MENAVRVTEQLKTNIRNTYNIKANILGPTACAMAMQIELTEQRKKIKGGQAPLAGWRGYTVGKTEGSYKGYGKNIHAGAHVQWPR